MRLVLGSLERLNQLQFRGAGDCLPMPHDTSAAADGSASRLRHPCRQSGRGARVEASGRGRARTVALGWNGMCSILNLDQGFIRVRGIRDLPQTQTHSSVPTERSSKRRVQCRCRSRLCFAAGGGTVGVDGAQLRSTRSVLRQQLGRRDATAMSCPDHQ